MAVDWVSLRATAPSRGELTVCRDPLDQLARERRLRAPFLIDAAGFAETIHARGETLITAVQREGGGILACSTDGAIPEPTADPPLLALTAWPIDADQLRERMREASAWPHWGLCIPLLHPLTTAAATLDLLITAAAAHGAGFAVAVPIEAEPAALSAVVMMSEESDETVWESLFDGSVEALSMRSARIAAAIANRSGLAARCPLPPGTGNWAAAALLGAVAERLFQLETDLELAWQFHRAATIAASLTKPLALVAESASLTIVEGFEPPIIEVLESWLAGATPPLLTRLDQRWAAGGDLYP